MKQIVADLILEYRIYCMTKPRFSQSLG